MTGLHRRTARALGVLLLALAPVLGAPARADDQPPVQIELKDHQFTPAEIHVKSGQPILLQISNADATAEEFEMQAPAIEKVIAGGGHVTVRLRPLRPGRFRFYGEYHEDTAKGVIIVE